MHSRQPRQQKKKSSTIKRSQVSDLLFQSFVKQHVDGVVLINSQGDVLVWNQAMERITGIPAQEIVGFKAWDMQMKLTPKEKQNPALLENQQAAYKEILTSGIVPTELAKKETQVYRRDGKWIYADQNLFIITVGKENWLGVLVRDISGRKAIELEREELIKKLEMQKAELERITYTMSHDLRSPLVTIKGYLGYLESDAAQGNTERFRSDLNRIGSATDKMDRLLKDLLELSRIGRFINATEQVQLETLIQQATELAKEELANKKLTVHIQPGLPSVNVDKARITEVFLNLIENAVRHMGEQPEPRIEIGMSAGKAANTPVFFVKDNGTGIEKKYHEYIFGLFNKINASTEGTGVGLTLVKRIIEFHHGTIWVESEPGKGSAFCFTLPQ